MFGKMPRWRLFKIWGHEIFMEPIFLALVAFFVFSGVKTSSDLMNGLLLAPILFFGLLWHELGHAITTKKFGYGDSQIVLQGMGAVAISRRPVNTPPKNAATIAVMGPVFSLSITLVFGLLYFFVPLPEGIWKEFCYKMALYNGVWAVFNLIPVNPLDGGHIMLAGFRSLFKNDRKAYLTTAYVSLAVLAVLALIASPYFGIMGLFIAIMVGYSNVQIIQQLK